MIDFKWIHRREWRFQHAILLVLVAGNFAQLGSRLLISPLIPVILDDFAVSKSEIGVALTGMWAMYALFQFPSGLLADRIGKTRVIVIALVLTSVGGLLIAYAPGFQSFRVFVILLGVGTGMYLSVAGSMLADLFDREGQALGFVTAGGAFAGLVAPLVAGYVSSVSEWRHAILVWTVLPFSVAITVAYVSRVHSSMTGSTGTTNGDGVDMRGTLSILSQPTIIYTLSLAMVTMFTWQAFATFLPTFFTEYLTFSTSFSAVAFGVFFLFSALLQPVMGLVSDRLSRDVVLFGALLLVAGSLGVLLLRPTATQVIPVLVLLGIGSSWAGVIQAKFMDALPEANRGSGFGLVRTIYLLVGSLGSGVTGTIADTVGWPQAMGLIGGLLLFAAALIALNRALDLGL